VSRVSVSLDKVHGSGLKKEAKNAALPPTLHNQIGGDC
jgi:hypothetical protein